ncbi:MAG: TonB-dependent receptor, partial [Candidatus Eremiobacteraeota bacterium]|nr:TonB-dependent receptor [Candidatus Eremiobacteraeota bacterium]
MTRRIVVLLVALAVLQCGVFGVASAGTTGGVQGRVFDEKTKAALAGARVSIASPSGATTTTTDASGGFRFLSLAPDTYTLSVERSGFSPVSLSGVTVLADQTQVLPAISLGPVLSEIARVRTRGANNLVRAGTTSDVYSVNAAGAEAAQAIGGPGGLNSAYSAIASVPGAVVQQGQQGWYQTVNIRGGDIDQVGYELDGIPVNRVYDNAPQSILSSVGQQELQVYTGGTPATADATGIAGYINQVIKTGSYPGYANVDVGLGSPTFYHKLSVDVGGATKNGLFSYYAGFAGIDQDYRYGNQFNLVSDPQFFYPVILPGSRFNLQDSAGTPTVAAGTTYAIATTSDRENVVNLHFGIPHHNDANKDDVQLLYTTSEVVAKYFSSIDDQGGPANVAAAVGNGGNAYYHDGYTYNGPLFAPVVPSDIVPVYQTNSPTNRAFSSNASNTDRDYSDNGVAILKLQYQRNFSPSSYLRVFGYSEYSNWFIGGPANAQFTGYYGAELNDYELPSHTAGFNASYSNQLSDKNLLTVSGSYTTARVSRQFSYGYPGNTIGAAFTNLVGPNDLCYDPTSLTQTSCFNGARGTLPTYAPGTTPDPSYSLPTGSVTVTTPAGTPATATWLATDNGRVNTRYNTVSPAFTAGAFNDTIRPNDKLTLTLGARVENFDDRLADTTGSAARQFWFDAYNNEHCYKLGAASPVTLAVGAGSPYTGATAATCVAAFGAGYLPADLVTAQGTRVSATVFEPRLGATYSLDPDTVLRGSLGEYARPANTSYLQYNAVNQDLASFIGGNFLTLGYNTPIHDLRPDTSLNADFSLEKHIKNTDLSFKLTPFYRNTKNQVQNVPIGVGGVVTGFNVGQQTSKGVEFALRKGDFGRDGVALQLAYTYTNSRIKYTNLPSGTNVIDGLNLYIQEYNSYTSACATITRANSKTCGLAPGAANPNAAATFTSADGTTQIANPYYAQSAQPLFDRNGEYTTYDQIPQPFTGENGYETPNVASLIVSYTHGPLTLTPSLTYSSGAKYGSPLAYPGYVPTGCAAAAGTLAGGVAAANPSSCTGSSAVSGLPFLIVPDAFTGKFDDLGAFNEPQRVDLNFAASYQAARNVKLSLVV